MKRIIIAIFIMVTICCFGSHNSAFCEEPKRENGLSAHWIPTRIATLGNDEKVQAGFLTSYRTKDEIKRIYCFTPTDLLEYFSTFPSSFQSNGIWIVMTNPDAYSPEELKMKNELIKLCQDKKINLFICRGAELPDGWRKYSSATNVKG